MTTQTNIGFQTERKSKLLVQSKTAIDKERKAENKNSSSKLLLKNKIIIIQGRGIQENQIFE